MLFLSINAALQALQTTRVYVFTYLTFVKERIFPPLINRRMPLLCWASIRLDVIEVMTVDLREGTRSTQYLKIDPIQDRESEEILNFY